MSRGAGPSRKGPGEDSLRFRRGFAHESLPESRDVERVRPQLEVRQFETLHHRHPGKAVGEFADAIGASLIVASTHGRTGLARLALGSVAMEIVRHAPCPVVLNRPPTLATQR